MEGSEPEREPAESENAASSAGAEPVGDLENDLPEPPELDVRLPDRPVDGTSESARQYGQWGLAYTVPIALVAPVVLLTWLGSWLDGRVGASSSEFTMLGAVLGLIVGLRNMISIVRRLNQ